MDFKAPNSVKVTVSMGMQGKFLGGTTQWSSIMYPEFSCPKLVQILHSKQGRKHLIWSNKIRRAGNAFKTAQIHHIQLTWIANLISARKDGIFSSTGG